MVSVKVENRPPPGVRRLAFYCDESGRGGDLKHYGFGALVMQYQRRGQFLKEFRDLARGRKRDEVNLQPVGKDNTGGLGHEAGWLPRRLRALPARPSG